MQYEGFILPLSCEDAHESLMGAYNKDYYKQTIKQMKLAATYVTWCTHCSWTFTQWLTYALYSVIELILEIFWNLSCMEHFIVQQHSKTQQSTKNTTREGHHQFRHVFIGESSYFSKPNSGQSLRSETIHSSLHEVFLCGDGIEMVTITVMQN